MRIEIEITYDAEKLAKEMKGIIKDFLKNTVEAFVVGSKKAIESGNFKKLKKSTLDIRKAGGVSSSKPLVHTGKFFKGINLLKNGDISVQKYALNHLPDDIFDMSEESVVTQATAEARAKSGIAYITADDSMIPNRPVPIRNWFRMDKSLAKKSISRFRKLLKKNFERKMSQKFSRFKA